MMYTEQDFEKAQKENKSYANLQYIEGEKIANNNVSGEFDKILNYLCNVISVLMTRIEIKNEDYKPLLKKISDRIEELYIIRKTAQLVQKQGQGQTE